MSERSAILVQKEKEEHRRRVQKRKKKKKGVSEYVVGGDRENTKLVGVGRCREKSRGFCRGSGGKKEAQAEGRPLTYQAIAGCSARHDVVRVR